MKKRNLFMSSTLMCGLFVFAFTFNNNGIEWLWSDLKPVALILGIATFVFGLLWFKSAKDLKMETKK